MTPLIFVLVCVLELFLVCFCFILGWICGARLTAVDIAEAVRFGDLSLKQSPEAIADQIDCGFYRSHKSSAVNVKRNL
jgi:hypothetical protein